MVDTIFSENEKNVKSKIYIKYSKKCIECNLLYTVKKSHFEKSSYCSRNCMALNYSIRFAGDANPNYRNLSLKNCKKCNSEFKTYLKTSKYCSVKCRSECSEVNKKISCSLIRRAVSLKKPWKFVQKEIAFTFDTRKTSVCEFCGEELKYKNARKYCSVACSSKKRKGSGFQKKCVICSEFFPSSQSLIKTTCSKKCSQIRRSESQVGDKSHRWAGGKTSETLKLRNSFEYKNWRTEIFKRDKYTCAMCSRVGGKITAHHIKLFSKFKDLRFDVGNGITLCWPCHSSINKKEEFFEADFFEKVAIASRAMASASAARI